MPWFSWPKYAKPAIICQVHNPKMLGRYLDIVEAQLEEARNLELTELHARLPGHNEAEREERDIDRQAIEETYEEFPRFQRYAFLMLAFMVFEARAKEFCGILGNKKSLS